MNPPEQNTPPPPVNQAPYRSLPIMRTAQVTGNRQRQPDATPTLQPSRDGRFPGTGPSGLWERLAAFFRKNAPQQIAPDREATQPASIPSAQATPARDVQWPQRGDAVPTLGRAHPADQSRHQAMLIGGGIVIAVIVAVAMFLWAHIATASNHAILPPQSRTGATQSPANTVTLREFGGLAAGGSPHSIIAGPDGNIWFVERDANQIGRITPSGQVTQFPIPTAASRPLAITAGPDGNLWFTEGGASQIGRITTGGQITEFQVPTRGSYPLWIVRGADGNLWFTERDADKIGHISPITGNIVEFSVPTPNGKPGGIAAGPDGNLWFTEMSGDLIGRITPKGQITEFGGLTKGSFPLLITAGPHQALWFTLQNSNRIGRLDTNGHLHVFRLPVANSVPGGITASPTGDVWFTEQQGDQIDVMASDGTILAKYTIPTGGSDPFDITTGPNGSIWFVEVTGNKIGRITMGSPTP